MGFGTEKLDFYKWECGGREYTLRQGHEKIHGVTENV